MRCATNHVALDNGDFGTHPSCVRCCVVTGRAAAEYDKSCSHIAEVTRRFESGVTRQPSVLVAVARAEAVVDEKR